jgi:hypothetical protein
MQDANPKNKPELDEILNEVKSYVGTTLELYKMKASEKGAEIASIAIINIVLGIFAAMVLLFASIALALCLSSYFGKMYLGFLLVALLYAAFSVIILLTKDKWLKGSLTDSIIRVIYSN